MRKINAFKNDAWKVERVQKTFENLNSFLDDVENAKNDANILKTYFFWIFVVFHYFLDFLKILSKWRVKNWVTTDAPSLQCLRAKLLNVLHSKLRKEKKRKMISLSWATCPFEEKWSIFRGDQPTHRHWSIFRGDLPTHTDTGLFSGAICPHTLTLVYFQGRPPTHTHTGLFYGRPAQVEKKEEWSCCNGWLTQVEEWSHCNGWPTQKWKKRRVVVL